MGIIDEKKEEIDQAFDLIQKGNEHEESADMWSASEAFGEASHLLRSLYQSQSIDKPSQSANDEKLPKPNEDEKITKLFESKSIEYLLKAQTSLLVALKDEMGVDDPKNTKSQNSNQYDNNKKTLIFQKAFAPVTNEEIKIKNKEEVPTAPMSIEERLNALNASLPPQLLTSTTPKTKEQELNDRLRGLKNLPPSSDNSGLPDSYREDQIHAGMERLGIHVNRDSNRLYDLGLESMSEEEQLSMIMSAVKDEIDLSRNTKSDIAPDKEDSKKKSEKNNVQVKKVSEDKYENDTVSEESSILSSDEIEENAIDLIYSAQDLLMVAVSLLDGEGCDDDELSLELEEGENSEDNNQKRSRKILLQANKSIKKAIATLK